MRLPVPLLLLAAISQAIPSLSARKTTDENKSSKRELAEAVYGLKDGAFYTLVSPRESSTEYSEEESEASEEQSEQPEQVFESRVPQYSKISDVLSGERGTYETAIANQLHSSVPIYKPRPTSLKVSQLTSSQSAYSELNHLKKRKHTSKQNNENIPTEYEQYRYLYKTPVLRDPYQGSNLLHLETIYPRLEPRLIRPEANYPRNILIRLPEQIPEQRISQLFSQFGLHQFDELPSRYTHENLKPVQYVQKQSLLQLVPANPASQYTSQEGKAVDDDDYQDNYTDNHDDSRQHNSARTYQSSTTRPVQSSTQRSVQSSTVSHLQFSTGRPSLPKSQKINEYHNIHPHGAVSHASFYTGELHSSQQFESRFHMPKQFSEVHPDLHNQKYVPTSQSPTKYSSVTPISMRLDPVKHKFLPAGPSPQSELLETESFLQYQKHPRAPQSNFQHKEKQQLRNEQEKSEFRQKIKHKPRIKVEQQVSHQTETQEQDDQFQLHKQDLNYDQETETEIQNVEHVQSNLVKEQPYQSTLDQEQHTVSPTEEASYTEAEAIRITKVSTTESSSNFNTVTDTSTTPTPDTTTTTLQSEISSTTLSSTKNPKFNRYSPGFKLRSPRPLLQRKPFYTKTTTFTTRKPVSFSSFRRHITTRVYSTTLGTETSTTLDTTTFAEAESTESLSTLVTTTTPTTDLETFQDDIVSASTEPKVQSTEFQPVKLPNLPLPITQPTTSPPTVSDSSTLIHSTSLPLQEISELEENPRSSFEPIKNLEIIPQPEDKFQSPSQIEYLSEPQESSPIFDTRTVSPHVFEPQPTTVTKSSPISRHPTRPDLPAHPQPGVIYQMRTQPPLPSEPLLQPRQSSKSPQQKSKYPFESQSSSQNQYQTASPQIFILSSQQPMYKKSANDLYLTYFPVSTAAPTYLLKPVSPLPRLQPHPESTLIPRPKPTAQPSLSTTVEPDEEPITPSYSQEEYKQKSPNYKTHPKPSEVLISHGPTLTPVQPIFQPHIYSQPQDVIFDPNYGHTESPQLNAFPNVQYFGNFAETVFGYPQTKR